MVLKQIGPTFNVFDPNKAGIFEYIFLEAGVVNLTTPSPPPSYLTKNLSNYLQLYAIAKQSI